MWYFRKQWEVKPYSVSISLAHVIDGREFRNSHPASYAMGTGALFLGKSGRGMKLTTQFQLVSRSRKMWIYTFTPPYASLA
jgi:hypothetical protein